jgi:anaerobic dimethyl sulfoxide reductase subunit B (iron-sulfur subunit)
MSMPLLGGRMETSMKKALLLNYHWCTGCHSCELACQVKNELPATQCGIKVNQVGPWEYAPKKWQYAYIPTLTEQCNLCGDRLSASKLPACVQHCQTNCIQILDASEAAEIAKENRKVLFMTLLSVEN